MKKSYRLALCLALSLSSFAAFAETLRFDCNHKQWQLLMSASRNARVVHGGEHRANFRAMLIEEMGPECQVVVHPEMLFGIPGDTTTDFEIKSGGRFYSATVTESMEMGETQLSIVKHHRND